MAARAPSTPGGGDKNPQKKSNAQPRLAPTEEQIRHRAHEIYLENGRQPGRDIENWLQAEAELRQGVDRVE